MTKKKNRAVETILEISDDQIPSGLIRAEICGLLCSPSNGKVVTWEMVKEIESHEDDRELLWAAAREGIQ